MMLPTYRFIERMREGYGPPGQPWRSCFQGTFLHPNPKFYKYYWYVFWAGSQAECSDFFVDAPRFAIAAAHDFMSQLAAKGEPYIVYNIQLPRLDPANPFDFNAPKWRKIKAEWALPYDSDPDPIIEAGALAGHR